MKENFDEIKELIRCSARKTNIKTAVIVAFSVVAFLGVIAAMIYHMRGKAYCCYDDYYDDEDDFDDDFDDDDFDDEINFGGKGDLFDED